MEPALEEREGVMRVHQLGHVVLKVRDRQRAEEFYAGVLGMRVAARMERPPMTFFSVGNHHDLAVVEVGPDGPDPAPNSPGLFHAAFKIGESLDELREAKAYLERAGVTIRGISDHTVSQSIYLADPDGNTIEVYVDTSDVWRTDPQAVATIAPLAL
jgi:catechol 2,3-dioxygenase